MKDIFEIKFAKSWLGIYCFLTHFLVYRNIAFGKVATSSSIAFGGSPQKAVDGKWNKGYYTRDGVCAHTKVGEPSFISVDLEREYTISIINVVGRDRYAGQSQGWTIRIGNTGTDKDPICSENVDAFGGNLIPVSCNSKISGRHVRVESANVMVLCEIQVFGGIADIISYIG